MFDHPSLYPPLPLDGIMMSFLLLFGVVWFVFIIIFSRLK